MDVKTGLFYVFSTVRLEAKAATWLALMDELRKRGDGCRESGAFLLGNSNSHTRQFLALRRFVWNLQATIDSSRARWFY
jgi:hypothetical protein